MTAWCDAELEARWRTLDALLARNAEFWKPHAFRYLQQPWQCDHPALANFLSALDGDAAEALARDAAALAAVLKPFIDDAEAIAAATAVPSLSVHSDIAKEPARDVPGRKWRQIVQFAATLQPHAQPTLEWCAGKSHLGCLLAGNGYGSVDALEWNAELVNAARTRARQQQLPLRSHCIDVSTPQALAHIRASQRVVALHACGDLHLQLLRGCIAQRPAAIALAPCCYHLDTHRSGHLTGQPAQGDDHAPLSQCARATTLTLVRDDLRTAVQGTFTSPPREQAQRKRLQAWRLGFDLLQRELRGVDAYLPTPSQPLGILRGDFAQFSARMAAHAGFALPPGLDYAHYEACGRARLRAVTALDLPRILFRRALELWLVLDRALWLREADYRVEVGTFCAPALTPRNLLIRARTRLR